MLGMIGRRYRQYSCFFEEDVLRLICGYASQSGRSF